MIHDWTPFLCLPEVVGLTDLSSKIETPSHVVQLLVLVVHLCPHAF